MGVAWGLVSGSALVKHTSKVFGVPRRLLGALMLDIRSPEPSAHSPSTIGHAAPNYGRSTGLCSRPPWASGWLDPVTH